MAALPQATLDWQPVLDAHVALFEPLAPGASVALVPRWRLDADGKRRANVMPKTEPVPMLLWLREAQAMRVRESIFGGLASLGSDLLFIAEDGALEAALEHERPLSELKRLLRRNRVLFMVLRTRDELRERGWSEFLEALGLPFLGTCR
ncbi:MAG: hypothetical protein R3357_01670 [Burkholderiales bacterium]|nr:hypothetical protein [Burkholderiales bacterium]